MKLNKLFINSMVFSLSMMSSMYALADESEVHFFINGQQDVFCKVANPESMVKLSRHNQLQVQGFCPDGEKELKGREVNNLYFVVDVTPDAIQDDPFFQAIAAASNITCKPGKGVNRQPFAPGQNFCSSLSK